jgi:hypothetical protein
MKGLPHASDCPNKDTLNTEVATVTCNGKLFYDAAKFCASCATGHHKQMLMETFSMTEADLVGQPLFVDVCRLPDVPQGATLVLEDGDDELTETLRDPCTVRRCCNSGHALGNSNARQLLGNARGKPEW